MLSAPPARAIYFLLFASTVLALAPLPLEWWVRSVAAFSIAGAGLVWHALGARAAPPGGVLLGGAILARLVLFAAPHELSDDAYRYHLDGTLVLAGVNPYRHAPDDPEIAPHRAAALHEKINHPDLVTVYPPLAELFFAIGAGLTPRSLIGIRLVILSAEIVGWLLLLAELRARGLPRTNLLLATALPVVAFESFLPGHTETLALPFLVLFFREIRHRADVRAGVAFGLACLVKPLPLLFVPAIAREIGPRRAGVLMGAAAATAAAFYAPFFSAGENLVSSTRLMARKWDFNGGFAALLDDVVPEPALRPILAVLLVALVLVATWRGRDLASRCLLAFGAFVLTTTTLYPWYLLWSVPLLVLVPDAAFVALLALGPLAHEVTIRQQLEGVWAPSAFAAWATHGTFAAWLLVQAIGRRGALATSPRG